MSQQKTITVAVRVPVAHSDLPGLCERIGDLIAECGATCAVCEVDGLSADAVAVDALARLRLIARRHGCAVRLDGLSDELRDLVSLVGLQEVLLGRTSAAATSRGAPGDRTGGTGGRCPGRT